MENKFRILLLNLNRVVKIQFLIATNIFSG